jgi:hypothetical protein
MDLAEGCRHMICCKSFSSLPSHSLGDEEGGLKKNSNTSGSGRPIICLGEEKKEKP